MVIIFDECHRSQFGEFHANISSSFKKYHLFGFTGTPIFAENAGLNGARAQLITAEAWNKSWVPPLLENKALLGFMPLRDDDFAVDDPAKI